MKDYQFHPEAEGDFHEAIDFYERQQNGLGRRLAGEVYDVIQRLRSGESGGSPWLRNSRLQTTRRFSYGIVFRELDNRIYILAVYHFSRQEGYWFHRLNDADDENA